MQINSVYLYSNKIDAFTSPLDSQTIERYRRVYNRNLKIYRSVDNRIDLQLRNSDQKPLTITNSLVFNLVSQSTGKLVVQKDMVLTPDDLTAKVKGRAYVVLSNDDMVDIEEGFYQYSVVEETRNLIAGTDEYTVSSSRPTYIDSQYGVFSTLEVVGDVLGTTTDSLVVNKFAYTNPFTTGSTDPRFYISSMIDARPKLATPQSLHTFQFYFNSFDGEVKIQGTTDDQGAQVSHWNDLLTFSPSEPVEYKNVTGRYSWFRIKYKPTSNSSTAGFVIAQNILAQYEVGIHYAGAGYQVGDTFTFSGRDLGGETPANDLLITVTGVEAYGRISNISWTGLSYVGVKTFVLDAALNGGGSLDKVLYR